MNVERLHIVFEDYIRIFDSLNSGDLHAKNCSNESYKWEIASKFRAAMDKVLDDESDVVKNLSEVSKLSKSLLENQHEHGLSDLLGAAKKEPEAVRELLAELCKNDTDDVGKKEKLIDRFVADSNRMLDKCFPGNNNYKMDFKTALNILTLYNPRGNYLYKPEEMKAAAVVIDFKTQWGAADDINLKVYYKMCNEVFEEVKKCPELIAKNKERFEKYSKHIDRDVIDADEDRLLVFDIFYSCGKYGKGLDPVFVDSMLRYKKACAEYEKMSNALSELAVYFAPGREVVSKAYGKGTAVALTENTIETDFGDAGVKKLGYLTALSGKILRSEADGFDTAFENAKGFLSTPTQTRIKMEFKNARKGMSPYLDYLKKYGETIM